MQNQQTLPIDSVVPNPLQPREYFNAEKMFQLKESVRGEGIMSPIVVMDNEDGSYLIMEGERRYRVAKELGHRDIPVVIEPKMDDIQMRIRQFQLQEYHEPWTPIERAKSIIVLAEAMNMTLGDVCKMLHITPRDARRFVSFASLVDKSAFVASEIPLDYTEGIGMLKGVARKVQENELDENFSRMDEKMIEARVIDMVKNGTVRNRRQLTKIADAMKKEPSTLTRMLDPEQVIESPEQLFKEAGAKGAHALRNTVYNARYLTQHAKVFLENADVKVTPEEFDALIRARDMLNKVIDIA